MLPLHLVGNLGFRIDDRSVQRAGLDYWPFVDVRREESLSELYARLPSARFFYFSARAARSFTEVHYWAGDCLIFGPESTGLPEDLLLAQADHAVTIPMRSAHVRSLNLSTAVGIAVYEVLRQLQ